MPSGQLIYSKDNYEIFYSEPDNQDFNEHRLKVWPLLLFYIETASYDCDTHDFWLTFTIY